jgi:hypothetical protein
VTLPATLLILGLVTLLGVVSGVRGAAPFDPVRGPRLVPWRFLMVTAVVVDIVLLAHLASLLGVQTGRP